MPPPGLRRGLPPPAASRLPGRTSAFASRQSYAACPLSRPQASKVCDNHHQICPKSAEIPKADSAVAPKERKNAAHGASRGEAARLGTSPESGARSFLEPEASEPNQLTLPSPKLSLAFLLVHLL